MTRMETFELAKPRASLCGRKNRAKSRCQQSPGQSKFLQRFSCVANNLDAGLEESLGAKKGGAIECSARSASCYISLALHIDFVHNLLHVRHTLRNLLGFFSLCGGLHAALQRDDTVLRIKANVLFVEPFGDKRGLVIVLYTIVDI